MVELEKNLIIKSINNNRTKSNNLHSIDRINRMQIESIQKGKTIENSIVFDCLSID